MPATLVTPVLFIVGFPEIPSPSVTEMAVPAVIVRAVTVFDAVLATNPFVARLYKDETLLVAREITVPAISMPRPALYVPGPPN